jgi:hypothetical protein
VAQSRRFNSVIGTGLGNQLGNVAPVTAPAAYAVQETSPAGNLSSGPSIGGVAHGLGRPQTPGGVYARGAAWFRRGGFQPPILFSVSVGGVIE